MLQTIIGIFLLLTYVGFVIYAVKGKNLLVGFLVLGLIWAIASGASYQDILSKVVQGGITGAGSLFLTIMFGSWFGRILVETGITSSIIRKAVELGGDKPLVVSILLSLVTAAIFTSSFGSGVVIAIGIIILPILMALGVPKNLAIGSYVMSIATGTIINAVYYNQLSTMIPGVEFTSIVPFCLVAMAINELCVFAMLFIGLRKAKTAKPWAEQVNDVIPEGNAPVYSFIVPIVPVLLAILAKWPILPAFIVSMVLALLLTGRIFKIKEAVKLIAKTCYDGFSDVALLIGMLSMLHIFIAAAEYATPIFSNLVGGVIPNNALLLVLVIALFAPIALFRGPLMWWGTGAATVAVLVGLGIFPNQLLFLVMLVPSTFMATSIDPTQGWNMWAMNYGKMTSQDLIKTTFIYAWVSCALSCVAAYFLAM